MKIFRFVSTFALSLVFGAMCFAQGVSGSGSGGGGLGSSKDDKSVDRATLGPMNAGLVCAPGQKMHIATYKISEERRVRVERFCRGGSFVDDIDMKGGALHERRCVPGRQEMWTIDAPRDSDHLRAVKVVCRGSRWVFDKPLVAYTGF